MSTRINLIPAKHSSSHEIDGSDEVLQGAYSGDLVFDNSAAPTADTDLDISSVVGNNRALVFIKIKDRGGSVRRVGFKAKGDTDTSYTSTDANASGVYIGSNNAAFAVATTDSDGILSWRSNGTGLIDVYIMAFVRLS